MDIGITRTGAEKGHWDSHMEMGIGITQIGVGHRQWLIPNLVLGRGIGITHPSAEYGH